MAVSGAKHNGVNYQSLNVGEVTERSLGANTSFETPEPCCCKQKLAWAGLAIVTAAVASGVIALIAWAYFENKL